jgi:hypothetical protein
MRASGRPATLALGISLAARGPLAVASIALAVMGAFVSMLAALAARGSTAARLPTTASLAIAWSAGVMLAFGASLRALPRDREDGVLALLRARGVAGWGYVRGRVGGLVTVLALTVGGATLAAVLAATAVARPAGPAVRAGIAALVYALSFSATVGPLAVAALGARTRAGGYLTLLAVLVVPELVSHWTQELLPPGWHELTSVPAALEALRGGFLPHGSASAAARAAVGLAAVVVLSLAVARARVARADAVAEPEA